MPENENKTISINVDDFQYYIRRDECMSRLEKIVRETVEEDGYLEPKRLLAFFE